MSISIETGPVAFGFAFGLVGVGFVEVVVEVSGGSVDGTVVAGSVVGGVVVAAAVAGGSVGSGASVVGGATVGAGVAGTTTEVVGAMRGITVIGASSAWLDTANPVIRTAPAQAPAKT